MLRRAALPLLLILGAGTAAALDPSRTLTQYVHRIWTVQQGLPSGTIYDMWQTRDGFLWLGTQTGLVRFDGVKFTAAETLFPAFPENLWIRAGLEDSRGALWVGTNDAGVFRVLNGEVKHYSTKEGLPSDFVTCLVPGSANDLWACTGNGLAHISVDDAKIDVRHVKEPPSMDRVLATCLADDGAPWVGGDGPGLSRWNGRSFDTTMLRGVPSDGGVRAIACKGSSIWVGTTAGLIEVKAGGQQKIYTTKDGLADDGVLSLQEGRDGTLWVGTRGGFSRVRNDELVSFRPQDGLSQSSVFSVYEDHEGSLWAGTKHGLNQFLEGRAIPYTVNEGLPSNDAGPLLQDASGVMWVGMLDAGLARFDGRRFHGLGVREGLASDTVLSLEGDTDGSIWVGTNRGLNLLRDGRVVRTYARASGLPSEEIRGLMRDVHGVLWAGTGAGLARLQGDTFRPVDSASRNPVLAMGSDREGRTLFSTEHGLFRMEGDAVREITPNGMSVRDVDAIYRDADGIVWLGTNGLGLRMLEESSGQIKMSAFFVRDGLFDGEIYGILPDEQGRLWMACSKGIFSVTRAELRRFAAGEIKKVSSTQYIPTDALRVIECKPGVQPGVFKMRDGRLWFSTIRGLMVLDPARLQRNVPPPPVVIEDPIVNGKSEPAGLIGTLAPGRKNLEFNYTGLSFVAPTRVTFKYMLEGYDKQWIDGGNRREAFYTNLPPNTFRFRVTACVTDGQCNDEGSSVQFTLAPQFYQRVWFWPMVAVVLALGGWLAYQMRIRHLRQRYDLIVNERSRIARELHDTLIQGFSGITMAMQALLAKLRPSAERERLEDIIHDAAQCLRETRRSVAGLRGAARQEASGLAAAVAGAAKQITETKDVRLRLKMDHGPRGLPAEVEYNLLRIATEAVQNSVKHSGARTIEVSLRTTAEEMSLSVSDDGAGFEPDEHGHLKPGHYGLIGMKERAAQIGAEFVFDSAPGRGTTVTVRMPVNRAAALEVVK